MRENRISRRRFLQGAIAAGAAGLLPQVFFSGAARAAGAANAAVVVVHLDGGCDCLNTVIPYQDPAYAAARPNLAIGGGSVLPLGNGLGLHPALTGIKTLFDSGNVAIVNNTGYPEFNRSHFQAEDIYWAADPSGFHGTGWLGRFLDDHGAGNVLGGAFIGTAVAKSMVGEEAIVPAIPSANGYSMQFFGTGTDRANQENAMMQIIGQAPTGEAFYDGLLAADVAANDSIGAVAAAVAGYTTGVSYATDSFSQGMKLAAQLIKADMGVRVISTSMGDFDTHAGQAARLDTSLGQLSAGVSSFIADARSGGFSERVVVLLWSEFGRRVAENASLGTDHGKACPMWLIGDGVKGGLYGGNPDLVTLDGGDLRMTTDFRSVYATVLGGWLGADANAVLGGNWPTLPVLL